MQRSLGYLYANARSTALFAHASFCTIGNGCDPFRSSMPYSYVRPHVDDRPSEIMHILLVEDCRDTADLFKEFFSLIGHDVSIAANAREALLLIESVVFDTIVLDIALPDLDGYTLACAIRRANTFKPRQAIIAVTAYAFDPRHPHAAEADFDAYLLKPARLEIIEAALQRYSIQSVNS
nr:response regulator [uncultured Duganella sp.]